jgi:alcohol dehydrogenase class IV
MATITYLTTIEFERGALAGLPRDLAALSIARPLIITDRGLAACGLLDRLMAALGDQTAVTVFDGTPQNPTEAAAEAAVELYRKSACDGIVAFGGGSPIDLAKATAVLATHPGPLRQYAAILGGVPKIGADLAPVVAVPTTAGTGSEVGRGALITFRDGRKLALLSPHLIPRKAICDPALTDALPPSLTAATGMDAFTHCVEAFLSPRINPPADAIALDGAGRAWRWIERAVADGADQEARWQMMMASLQGGLVFQKGLGAVHALSHPLGGLSQPVLHHGTLNAVILPAVLAFNRDHVGDKYDALRRTLGLSPDADLADAVRRLNERIGLPPNLRAMGVEDAVLPRIVEGAVADHSTATNPRPAAAADYEQLLAAAIG